MSNVSHEVDYSQYKLNWQPKPQTESDPLLSINHEHPRAVRLASSVDLSAGCSGVKDQGSLGSCTAFAGCGLMEYIMKANGLLSPDEFFSELFLYWVERVNIEGQSGQADDGAALTDCAAACNQYGVCQASVYPYDVNAFANQPPQSAYDNAANYKVQNHARVDESNDVNQVLTDIKTTLSEGYPVMGGFTCYASLMSQTTAETGVVPDPGGSVIGGHAIMFVGYDDSKAAFKFKNSWGTGWGMSGFGYLPYSYVLQGDASDFWTFITEEAGSSSNVINVIPAPVPAPTPAPPPPPPPAPTPAPTPAPPPTPTPAPPPAPTPAPPPPPPPAPTPAPPPPAPTPAPPAPPPPAPTPAPPPPPPPAPTPAPPAPPSPPGPHPHPHPHPHPRPPSPPTPDPSDE